MLDNFVHILIVHFVRIYKYFELKLYRLISKFVCRIVEDNFERAGIVVAIPDKDLKNGRSSSSLGSISENNIKNPAQIQLLKPGSKTEFFLQVALNGNLGFGEMYMNHEWECSDLVGLMTQMLESRICQNYFHVLNRAINNLLFHTCNLQTKDRVWTVADVHYDLGNELYEAMLGPTMNYTCGYWSNVATTLDQAQVAKMDLIAKKLKLEPGMKVLDLGCGWGALAKYLATHYDVEVVACTIGKNGAEYGRKICAGLPVDIRLMDYRDIVNEQYDRITAIGLMEHVGHKNYAEFLRKARTCLKDDGILLIHTIGVNHSDVVRIEPFFHKYIFPNGVLPTARDVTRETEGLFIIEDWHNFSHDYYRTLVAWRSNFEESWEAKLVPTRKYDARFYRMWEYYLTLCAAAFKSRKYQLWQIVLTKGGMKGGYVSVR